MPSIMKLLIWNFRGLENLTTIQALKKCLKRESPDVIFFMETQQSTKEMKRLNTIKIGYEGCFPVESVRVSLDQEEEDYACYGETQ